MVEGQPTSTEPHQDLGDVVGFSTQHLAKVNVSEVPVASARINVPETARNLGVIVDIQLTLSAQVAAMCRSGYY